jgi:predicted GNAT family acetyltransferase
MGGLSMNDIGHRDGAFFIERDGKHIAELTYRLQGEDAVIDHTFVDPDFRGGTFARDLVAAAVQWARKENRKLVPMCPYVRSVLAKTPEYADVSRP